MPKIKVAKQPREWKRSLVSMLQSLDRDLSRQEPNWDLMDKQRKNNAFKIIIKMNALITFGFLTV